MKIVMLCTKYSTDPNSPYLTDELAGALAARGHDVTVLVADWSGQLEEGALQPEKGVGPRVIVERPVVVDSLPLALRRLLKWALSSVKIATTAHRLSRLLKPDLVIAYSPLVALYLPVWILTREAGRRFLVQWDFFPDSHVQNHLLHGAIKIRILRMLETYLMRRFDVVGCMSPRNIEYLRENCGVTERNVPVHLPLWTSAPSFRAESQSELRKRLGVQADVTLFVFGGQFIPGRGIEDIIAATHRLDKDSDKMAFLFVGRGPLEALITEEVDSGNPFIKRLHGVPRTEYLGLLSACDVGLVCTVHDVTVPTFPSKTLDYLLAGIPILASVEASTDYGEFIEAHGIGLRVLAGDLDGFVAAARKLRASKDNRDAIADRCQSLLKGHFSVENAANIVLGVS